MPLWHAGIWKRQLRDAALYWLVIPGLVILSGLALDSLFALPSLSATIPLATLALTLLAAGLALIARASRDLAAMGQGTPNPSRPPKRLVTTGVYQWCRHPMFLGYDLGALGVVLLFRSWAMLLMSFPLMLAWQIRFLHREEELLGRRFRREYDGYRTRVPLLLPWPRPGKTQRNR